LRGVPGTHVPDLQLRRFEAQAQNLREALSA
jgi:hypothetical protein